MNENSGIGSLPKPANHTYRRRGETGEKKILSQESFLPPGEQVWSGGATLIHPMDNNTPDD